MRDHILNYFISPDLDSYHLWKLLLKYKFSLDGMNYSKREDESTKDAVKIHESLMD